MISIGNADKLDGFLQQNPLVPRDSMFVDDFDFDLFKTMGFQSFLRASPEDIMSSKTGLPKGFSISQYANYARTFLELAPFTEDLKFGELPPGGLVNGGTLVVKGDRVLFRWNDRLPGDHPEISDVVNTAAAAAAAEQQ